VHTVGVVETTDVVPPLSVETTALKVPSIVPADGRFEIVSVEGVLPATLNV
jgi:hypothetical protein